MKFNVSGMSLQNIIKFHFKSPNSNLKSIHQNHGNSNPPTKWVFPKIRGTPNGCFIMENPIKILLKWMMWGYLYFRKHPNNTNQPFRDFTKPPTHLFTFDEAMTFGIPPNLDLSCDESNRKNFDRISNRMLAFLHTTWVWHSFFCCLSFYIISKDCR